jgi:hypothetical protein
LKKNKKSSHKLPKQQSTNFWSQGILGVKLTQAQQDIKKIIYHNSIDEFILETIFTQGAFWSKEFVEVDNICRSSYLKKKIKHKIEYFM